MRIDIVDRPLKVSLIGRSGPIGELSYGQKGQELMDSMWSDIRDRAIQTHGLNHWVYLPGNHLFTGVELKGPLRDIGSLERIEVVLSRFVRHVHVGPYSGLPGVWDELLKRIEGEGEARAYPNMEIYGHWTKDTGELKTTILIGLEDRKV